MQIKNIEQIDVFCQMLMNVADKENSEEKISLFDSNEHSLFDDISTKQQLCTATLETLLANRSSLFDKQVDDYYKADMITKANLLGSIQNYINCHEDQINNQTNEKQRLLDFVYPVV